MRMIRMCIVFYFFVQCHCMTDLEIPVGANPYVQMHQLIIGNSRRLEFAVVLPEELDETRAYPVLLGLPPGVQDRTSVEYALDHYWIRSSIRRNWIVVCPVAPDGIRFFEGSEALIPDLLNWVEARYEIEGGRIHVAGASSGGISAFRVVLNHPGRFCSILVFPGYPTEEDFKRLEKLMGIHTAMFVGQLDTHFLQMMDATARRLRDLDIDLIYKKLPSEDHDIKSITSEEWFDILDRFRTNDATL